MTVDKIAHLGTRDGADFAAGCNGNGVALMTFSATRWRAKFSASRTCLRPLTARTFTAVPFYSGKPWFVPLFAGWYRCAISSIVRALIRAERLIAYFA